MADSIIDQIFADGAQLLADLRAEWITPRPPFEVGQLWQCEGRDTWRVIGASADGMIATLQVLAHAGRRTDGYATLQVDQREWLRAAHWCTVPQVRLMGGEVLR